MRDLNGQQLEIRTEKVISGRNANLVRAPIHPKSFGRTELSNINQKFIVNFKYMLEKGSLIVAYLSLVIRWRWWITLYTNRAPSYQGWIGPPNGLCRLRGLLHQWTILTFFCSLQTRNQWRAWSSTDGSWMLSGCGYGTLASQPASQPVNGIMWHCDGNKLGSLRPLRVGDTWL